VPANEAVRLSDAMADWIDSDERPAPNGAEDDVYRAGPVPYRPPNRLIGDVSELRAVRGMTPVLYQRLRPWLCALPAAGFPGQRQHAAAGPDPPADDAFSRHDPPERARALVLGRPPAGYASAAEATARLGARPGQPARFRLISCRCAAAGSCWIRWSLSIGAAGGGSADRYRGDARARGVPQLG
jgi:general secretion pathway protein K